MTLGTAGTPDHARWRSTGASGALLILAALAAACSSKDGEQAPAASGGSAPQGGGSQGGSSQGGKSGGSQGGASSGGSSTGGSGQSGSSTGGGSTGGSASGGAPAGGAAQGGTDDGGMGGDATSTGGTAQGGAASGGSAGEPTSGTGGTPSTGEPEFTTRTLSPDHVAEGAAVGDINADGEIDLVAGPIWYAGPDFEEGGRLFDAPTFSMNEYSTFFLTFVDDLNGDDFPDVIAIGDAGGGNGTGTPNTVWYENPGPDNLDQDWVEHPVFDTVGNESPAYLDLVGDARRELVFMTDGQLGYAQPAADPTAPWVFHAVSGDVFNPPYVHGLGVGDVSGDGLMDVVERTGWWEQIDGGGGEPDWEQHTVDFGEGADKSASNWGGSQMYVYDIDGDDDADVVTALAAHRYGLSWFEQDGGDFVAHEILPASNTGDSFSQLHAAALADVNADGLPDFITGKRYYAHPQSNADPGTTDPPVIYWFELERAAEGARFVPHLIDDASGVGCVFVAQDLTGDGKVDVFTTSKRGTFLHTQL